MTDSAYGFLTGMMLLALWGINWVTSFRLGQRRGFLGITEFHEAAIAAAKKKGVQLSKRNQLTEVRAWEKQRKEAKKGTSNF